MVYVGQRFDNWQIAEVQDTPPEGEWRKPFEHLDKGIMIGIFMGIRSHISHNIHPNFEDFFKRQLVFIIAYSVFSMGLTLIINKVDECIRERRFPRLD